jgi:hypothetical protein
MRGFTCEQPQLAQLRHFTADDREKGEGFTALLCFFVLQQKPSLSMLLDSTRHCGSWLGELSKAVSRHPAKAILDCPGNCNDVQWRSTNMFNYL